MSAVMMTRMYIRDRMMMSEDGLFTIPGEKRYKNLRLYESISIEALKKIPDLDFSGDVIISSYPKTGSHWSKEMTWLVQNDGDIEGAKSTHISERAKYLEGHYPNQTMDNVDRLMTEQYPRVMATHLPASYFLDNLDRNTKFVVVIRNPKDTLVSYYGFYKGCDFTGHYQGSWDEYFELYKAKYLPYCDYFDFYEEWIPHLQRDNVMLLKFEDMLADLPGCIRNLGTFLGKDLSEETVQKISEHGFFDKMKANPMTNFEGHKRINNAISPFMRKGKVADWKNYFTEDQSKLIDEKYEDVLVKSGIELRFD